MTNSWSYSEYWSTISHLFDLKVDRNGKFLMQFPSNSWRNTGSGRFLMWLAKRNPNSKNYLGLEIRRKVWQQIPCMASNPLEKSLTWVNILLLCPSLIFEECEDFDSYKVVFSFPCAVGQTCSKLGKWACS